MQLTLGLDALSQWQEPPAPDPSRYAKITDDRGVFSATLAVGRDKSIDVYDADQLPDDYMREIPARYEPDKAAIRSAMDDGFDVPGARIVARDRLTIK